MKPVFHKKYFFNPNHLLIDHNIIDFEYHSDIPSFIKRKKDKNEKKLLDFISDNNKFEIKPYYTRKETIDFLSSKLEAMKKMNLDDECCVEGKIETRKIDIDKKVFPKKKYSKNKRGSLNPKNKIDISNLSRKESTNKKNNKNIIINANGEIKKSSMKSIELEDNINFDNNIEIREKELNQFFSHKRSLTTIIDEINGK